MVVTCYIYHTVLNECMKMIYKYYISSFFNFNCHTIYYGKYNEEKQPIHTHTKGQFESKDRGICCFDYRLIIQKTIRHTLSLKLNLKLSMYDDVCYMCLFFYIFNISKRCELLVVVKLWGGNNTNTANEKKMLQTDQIEPLFHCKMYRNYWIYVAK